MVIDERYAPRVGLSSTRNRRVTTATGNGSISENAQMTPILVYTYANAAEFQAGAAHMARGGYYPINQSYKPGATSHNPLLLILGIIGLLFFIIPGVILLIIWAAYTTTGPAILTVTYQLTGNFAPAP
jgi:hypothetical protein